MSEQTLDHLTRTATEHGPTALWMAALPWLVETCGAVGGQILVNLTNPVRRVFGRVTESLRAQIGLWESDLQMLDDWLPAGRSSLSGQPPAQALVVEAELPIAHIPIYEGGALIGGLSLVFGEGCAPDANLIATANGWIQSLARMATLAAERYQLQRRLTQTNLLYEVSRAISSSLEIDVVLSFTTALAANALGAEGSALLLVDHDSNELVSAIVHGGVVEPLRGRRVGLGSDLFARVVRTGQPLSINNLQRGAPLLAAGGALEGLPARDILCAPLQVKGATLGVLLALNREGGGGFAAEDMEWLMALAGQASVAIENARLYSTLREERDRIIQAEEEVRRRLARNLHDSAAQLTSTLLMHVEVARKLAQSQPEALAPEFDVLAELAQQINHELRQALLELRPLLLESRGLFGALQGYVNQQRRRGQNIALSIQGALPEVRNKQAESAVYLILLEALSNVRKHAHAQHTWLRLEVKPPVLILEVEDDGVGMPVDKVDQHYAELGRMGLLTMHERVQWLEGSLRIESPCTSDGRGTRLRIELPLARLVSPPGSDAASWVIAAQSNR